VIRTTRDRRGELGALFLEVEDGGGGASEKEEAIGGGGVDSVGREKDGVRRSTAASGERLDEVEPD